MKKSLLPILIGCSIAIISCGPSAEEKAAAEKAIQDSIAQVAADSMRMVMEDSLAAAKVIEDSIAAANQKMMEDSIAALSGKVKGMEQKAKTKKATEEKNKKEVEQINKGKG